MKKIISMSVLLFVSMIITPLLSVSYVRVEPPEKQEIDKKEIIKVMSSDNGFIKELDTKEYLVGCVAGEMPPSYHKEALKAQAVCAYTYARYISLRDGDSLGGADISDDDSLYQSYLPLNQRKEKWGKDFDKNEKLISDAVDEVLYTYLSYENKPAMTVYHAVNSGKTDSSKNVWGKDFPYLESVLSIGDKLSPDYISYKEVSVDEFKKHFDNEDATDLSDFLGDIKRSDSGLIEEIEIFEKPFTGSEIREMFSLKSADFDIEIKENNAVFTCRGNGHFVGMSQYGADFMARQGSTYDEILKHYYPQTKLMILKK